MLDSLFEVILNYAIKFHINVVPVFYIENIIFFFFNWTTWQDLLKQTCHSLVSAVSAGVRINLTACNENEIAATMHIEPFLGLY